MVDEILDLHHHFQNDDLRNKEDMPQDEYIALVRSRAEEFEKKIAEAPEGIDFVNHFTIDENLMQLVELLDKLKTPKDDKDLRLQKSEAIRYIRGLQEDKLDLKQKGARIEKEFLEKLENGQVRSFSDLHCLTPLSDSYLSPADYVALLQVTADVLTKQFKTSGCYDRDEIGACYEKLSWCLMLARREYDMGPLRPYEMECELHIRQLLRITPKFD